MTGTDWTPPPGWVPLTTRRWSLGAGTGGMGFTTFVMIVGMGLLNDVLEGVEPTSRLPSWLTAVIASLVVGLAFLALTLLILRLTPLPAVHFDEGLVREGRRVFPISAVRAATLVASENTKRTKRHLTLVLAVEKKPMHLALRKNDRVIDREFRLRIAELIRRSSVELPVSAYDPAGKFARYNFPGALTKEQAIEVALDPPGPGEPLPVIGGNATVMEEQSRNWI